MSIKPSIRRKPVQGSSPSETEWEASTAPSSPSWDDTYLRQRQLDTATEVDACLSSASDLLSTASTLWDQAPRRSFGDDFEQSDKKKARILEFIQEQHHEEGTRASQNSKNAESALMKAILALPRSTVSLLLLGVFLTFWGFLIVYVIFWGTAQACRRLRGAVHGLM